MAYNNLARRSQVAEIDFFEVKLIAEGITGSAPPPAPVMDDWK